MIKVVARSRVKPDKVSEYKALAARLVVVTRKDKGCISYSLYQDVHDEFMFSFIEEWHDGDSLAAHLQSKHFNAIVPLLNELREGETETHVYREVR